MKILATLALLLIVLCTVRGFQLSTRQVNPGLAYAQCLINANILYNLCNQQVGNWPMGTLPATNPGVVFCNLQHANYNAYCLAVFQAATGGGSTPCTGANCPTNGSRPPTTGTGGGSGGSTRP